MRCTAVRMLATLVSFAALSGCNLAGEPVRWSAGKKGGTGFQYGKIVRPDKTVRKYAVFIPPSYDPQTKYPVIIFLHGKGEGSVIGEGDGKQLTVGLGPSIAQQKNNFPFICIFPQSDGEWKPTSEYAHDVIRALDDVARKYAIDPDRVALTGISTGGYGTYAIGAMYRKRFAALVPMASNAPAKAEAAKLAGIPVRAYCSGGGDMLAGVNDRSMVGRINALGGDAEFIATPTSGHNCWDYVYGGSELYRWLEQQSRESSDRVFP